MPIRLLFITPRFADGGGERIWVNLLRCLDRSRFKPVLAFCEHVESHFLREIPEDVEIYDLNKSRRFSFDWPRILLSLTRVLRREAPDIVVSLLHTWGFVLHLARSLSTRDFAIVINEHIHVSSSLNSLRHKRPGISAASGWLHRYCYRHADLIIPVAHDVALDLISNYDAFPERVKVIYNGIDLENIRRMAQEPVNHPWFHGRLPIIMGIGRLSEQKGFSFLIQAFKKVFEAVPSKLVILGEGAKRGELEARIRYLRLEDDVALLGRQPNPYKYLARSAVFVLSSVGEALPTVILEAMALGIPIVSTRCPCGPEELLEDGKYGLLVPVADKATLASGILEVLQNPTLRATLSERSREKARQFHVNAMVQAYEQCFEKLVQSSKNRNANE